MNRNRLNIPIAFHSAPILLLPIAMITCGIVSVFFGKELCWDLAHYHFYTPYAFLHHRANLDFWPTSFIAQSINPAIDFLTYFLIKEFSPLLIEFFLGAIHGINWWLLFLIARFFLPPKNQILTAILFASLGMYGPTALPGIGSFQNDNLISIFILGFVFFLLKTLQSFASLKFIPKKSVFLSGFLLGIGTGLKLTAALFALGGLFACAILPVAKSIRIKLIFLLSVAIASGILLTAGYWMMLMWQQHQNPFFPFFNNIFHSPDFSAINWRDKRFLPHGLWETLFFPFYFSWDGRTADAPFRDLRFLIVYALFILALAQYIWKKWAHIFIKKLDLALFWFYAFFIFSYVIWQYYFAISRYIAALEMLAPLMIYLLVRQIIGIGYLRLIVLVCLFYTLVFFMIPIPMVRKPWYNSTFFNIKLPMIVKQTSEAMVLMAFTSFVMDANPRPQTYLIPFFPKKWRFVGIPFLHEKYFYDFTTTIKINELVQDYPHKIFLLSSANNMLELYRIAINFGLRPAGQCEIIFSDRQIVTGLNVLLCPVAKTHM